MTRQGQSQWIKKFTVVTDILNQILWPSSSPNISPIPNFFFYVLPPTLLFLPFQENDPSSAPKLEGPFEGTVTLGNCSAGPTTSKMVGLFSVASALPFCFPKKVDIWSPRAGVWMPLTP